MSGANTWCVVYNGSESSQVYDEEGHAVDPGLWVCARRSFVKHLTDAGTLIVVDPETIGDDSHRAARMAKEEAERRNAEIDAEKAAEAAPAKTTSSKAKSNSDKQQ